MRKLFLLALLLFPLSMFGQVVVGNGLVQYVTSAPSGSCSQNAPMQIVFGPGTIYTCQTGTWTSIAGGGGTGTVTSVTCGTNLTGGTFTTSGTCAVQASPAFTGTPTVPTAAAGTNTPQAASTAYVTTGIANAIAGVNPAVAVQAATATVLPNSPSYNNGVAGIGAFLTTATTNTVLVVDGVTIGLNDRVLVKNQGSSFQNGVYFESQLQGIGLAWILTRALDYDTPSDMNNTGAIPVISGTVNTITQWVQSSQVTTVGTDAVTFAQFSINPASQPSYSTASTPAAPTLATVGSAGSTTISYKIVGCQDLTCTLHTPASAQATIATANATLTSSNYVKLSAYLVHLDGASCYNVYRTAAGGTPSTTGLIASCVGEEWSDQGSAGDSGTAPTANTTILVSNPMILPGCAIAVGGYTNPLAPQCTPKESDDDFGETGSSSLTLDPRWTKNANFGTATIALANGGMTITGTQAGNTLRILHTPVTGSTYTYVAYTCNSPIGGGNGNGSGIELDDGTKITALQLLFTSSFITIEVDKWTNATTYSSTPFTRNGFGNCAWLRVRNDNTSVFYDYSPDGLAYTNLFSEAKGAFFTTAPTNVGYVMQDTGNPAVLNTKFFHQTQ